MDLVFEQHNDGESADDLRRIGRLERNRNRGKELDSFEGMWHGAVEWVAAEKACYRKVECIDVASGLPEKVESGLDDSVHYCKTDCMVRYLKLACRTGCLEVDRMDQVGHRTDELDIEELVVDKLGEVAQGCKFVSFRLVNIAYSG